MTDIEKLNFPRVPDHKEFYSSLTNFNITEEEYQIVKKTWVEKGWKTLKDHLEFYNVMDCQPFIEAVERMRQPYLDEGLDLFKIAFSISGLAKFQMLNRVSDNAFFCLYPKRHADLYHKMRSKLVGGLSYVSCRLAFSEKSRIRSHQIENAEIVKRCAGYDANSLYLYALMQECPSGYFTRYKESNNYKPDMASCHGIMAHEYLSWISFQEGKFIQTQYNKGEKILTKYSLRVDGFCLDQSGRYRGIVYEFLGCFWHSCECKQYPEDEINTLTKRKHSEVRKATQEKIERLEEAGYKVVTMRECEWKILRKQPQVSAFIRSLPYANPRRQLSKEKILEGISKNELYGFLFVDIETPQHLKEKFDEFPMIYKNIDISRDDIGDYMKRIAEEHGFLKKPRKYLVNSHFGKDVLISSSMVKFYLEMGLEITRIYEFVQFYPIKCFQQLGVGISNARRLADQDSSKQVLGLTQKLLGNSCYSASLLNKLKYRNITYRDDLNVSKAINNPYFCDLTPIEKGIYEVNSLKRKITLDLPIQLGLMVYCESKLHMLKFFYLFLKKFIPKQHFELLESDTDSIYISMSKTKLEDCVPTHLKREFHREMCNWMPVETCENHKELYIDTKAKDLKWEVRSCCKQQFLYQLRTPGLFKLEYDCANAVCLSAKTHLFSDGDRKKQVSKGVSLKTNNYSLDDYFTVLSENSTKSALNKGFMQRNHKTFTYSLHKRGLTPFYCKRIVLEDGIHSTALKIQRVLYKCTLFCYFFYDCSLLFYNKILILQSRVLLIQARN